MDLHQIRYFVHLADTLNFTEAARRSGVSQPSLTRAVRRLEEELGGPLLYRDGKNSRLTALGRQVQGEFMRMESLISGVQELAANSVRGRKVALRVGVALTVASVRLSRFWAHVLTQLPDAELHISTLGPDEGELEVLAGKYDVCILAEDSKPHFKLTQQPLYRENLLLAMSTSHRLAQHAMITPEQMAGEPYLDRLNCEFRTRLIEHFMSRNAVMQPRIQSSREDWVQQLAAAGLGVCVLPEYSALASNLAIRPVEGLDLYRTVTLVTVSGSGVPMEIRQIVAMAKRFAWKEESSQTLPRGAY